MPHPQASEPPTTASPWARYPAMFPHLSSASTVLAMFRRSSLCSPFRTAWPESPSQHPLPSSARHRSGHCRRCTMRQRGKTLPFISRHVICVGRSGLDLPVHCVIGPQRAMDPARRACISARTRRVVHRANPSAPCVSLVSSRVNIQSSHAIFLEKPFYFCRFNPHSITVQINYKSALFLFV